MYKYILPTSDVFKEFIRCKYTIYWDTAYARLFDKPS